MSRASTSRVLAVVVAHGEAPWLPAVLASLDAQDHVLLDVVAVDSGASPDTRAMLLEHFGPSAVFIADRDIGFGAAVNLAADTALAHTADYLVLVHDDCALASDAISQLAAALDADDTLAAVGPKLVRWDQPRRLEAVGMTVDATGRADTGLDPDELDQGQRDGQRPVLYVPTAGMMVRRTAFEASGRMDRRYHVFRDDLDLCWRLWLAGHDVHVVPDAVAHHASGAANYLRLGQTAFLGPRYFAERNTLATLLKLYGPRRLVRVLPLFLLVGLAKMVGFVATRRVGDAWQTLRAWAWNLAHLPETWRLRRQVQALRVRDDDQIEHLFGRIAPRVRAYGEAVAFWLTTGEGMEQLHDEEPVPPTVRARLLAGLRGRPVTIGAIILTVIGVLMALPLLQSSTVRAGELAHWPGQASAFFKDYGASLHAADGLTTVHAPSPVVGLLGLLTLASFDSPWLAPRVLVLGALPAAWLLSLVALRGVSSRRLPQVAGATLYVLSPPVLAALRTGQVGALATAVLLPALGAAWAVAQRPDARSTSAWRATAGGSILAAIAIAFVPALAWLLLAATVVGLVAVSVSGGDRAGKRAVRMRLVSMVAGTFLLLMPWSLDLVDAGSPLLRASAPTGAAAAEYWRLLVLVPELPGFPGLLVGVGLMAGAILGLLLGLRRRPATVVLSWLTILALSLAAWLLGRAGAQAIAWPGVPLIVAAGAAALLAAVAFGEAGRTLSGHAFGWRHVAAGATVLLVVVGLGASVRHLADDPWGAYALDEQALPSFLASEAETVGTFRVLVLEQEAGVVAWDVTGPGGPTMLRFGQGEPVALRTRVEADLADVLSGADPGAAARLGLMGVRYIVVPAGGTGEQLDRALEQQLDLEPLPTRAGRVFRVASWLPRISWVRTSGAESILNQRTLPLGSRVVALEPGDHDTWTTDNKDGGSIFIAEPGLGEWAATADGQRLEARVADGQVHFDLDGRADRIVVEQLSPRRRGWMAVHALLVLTALSLVLRPPRFSEQEVARVGEQAPEVTA